MGSGAATSLRVRWRSWPGLSGVDLEGREVEAELGLDLRRFRVMVITDGVELGLSELMSSADGGTRGGI